MTGDLTTLANVKQWLNLTAATDDALLSRMISAVSAYVQSWLNRQFAAASYSERRDGNGKTKLLCANYPLTAVSAVVINGQNIPPSASVSVPGYYFDAYSIRLRGYSFAAGHGNVEISYTAGYATTPPEIEQAVIETIALRYKERDRIGHTSKSVGGETVSFTIADFSPSVRTILNNYRKVVPL